MSHLSGIGGFSPSAKCRSGSLSRKGKKALSLLKPENHGELMVMAHEDSDSLRQFAERFKRQKEHREKYKESVAQFGLDEKTGQIHLTLYDVETGHTEMFLTPEEVAEGLKKLEETEDNDKPLSSFFVDINV